MVVGPVFTREAVTVPRRLKFYLSRAAYVTAFWVLMLTLWMVLAGAQNVRNIGDLARFGAVLFRITATLQMAVVVFFAALSTASSVALEKDRRTLVLLLMTRLSNSQLVLGKLFAGMLNVLTLLVAALPFFLITALFGGVSYAQIFRVFAVLMLSALAAGSLGSLVALWREKTFQTLALTALILVFWPAGWEIVRLLFRGSDWSNFVVVACSPVHAILFATQAYVVDPNQGWLASPVNAFLLVSLTLTVALNTVAILCVRLWNPPRESRRQQLEDKDELIFGDRLDRAARSAVGTQSGAPLDVSEESHKPENAPTREVWDNPILWREIRTWAYGRKVMFVKAAYFVLASLSFAMLYFMANSSSGITQYGAAMCLAPLFVLSMLLINAQSVTALTSERDSRALDLLLVSDITPKEFVFGKLGGILYNSKEMIVLPILLCAALWWLSPSAPRGLSLENLVYLVVGMLVIDGFVAMLGVHTGMAYGNSRTAIATSLGTVFFLFIGVATCMWIMVVFGSGSFHVQLAPFVTFMLGGGVGLYIALGSRNPSPAIGIASLVCPFATFYAITSFLLGHTLSVMLVVVFTYGFTTAAMLVPALYEFDVATGRDVPVED